MLSQYQRRLNRCHALERDPALARHVELLAAWRRRSPEDQWLAMNSDNMPFAPGLEPDRGRVRVGLFCPCLGLGGAETWQLALVEATDPAAVVWRGAVVTEGKRSVAPAMLAQLAGKMPVGFGLEAARTLAESVDVIVSWSVLDHEALFRGLARPPRVILACHFPGELPWTRAAEQLLAKVDQLVAVSELAVESLPESLRAAARVIWNGVDGRRLVPTANRQSIRAAWNVPALAPVVGYLGRLAPEKDPDAMLRLAEHLPASWHVVLVGDGRDHAALTEKRVRSGLDRVHLIPGTAAVGNALAALDALVVPSRYESFGLTMAEGFWTGVPVIATRVGLAKLQPELVRAVGFVPSGVELADAVLADHEHDRDRTTERIALARRFARDRLDLARFGSAWTTLIEEQANHRAATIAREESCRLAPQVA